MNDSPRHNSHRARRPHDRASPTLTRIRIKMREASTARRFRTAAHADDGVANRLDPDTEDGIDAEEDRDMRSDRGWCDLRAEGEEGAGGEDGDDQEDEAEDVEDKDRVHGAVLAWRDVAVGWGAGAVGVEIDG